MTFNWKLTLCFFSLFFASKGTIDINLAEYQYIADHLTQEECHKLVAALHFKSFELPKQINSAERRLPNEVPCVDLLLHWNSTPKEGKGKAHVEVAHRLNQLGREDLAQWLSKTVFHELSKDVEAALNISETESTSISPSNATETYIEEILDESAWWKIDSLLSVLLVFALLTLIAGTIYLCYLCISNKYKKSNPDYQQVSTDEN